MLCTFFAFLAGTSHKATLQAAQNDYAEDNKISFIPMFYLLDEVAT